jgi:RimJ/RimL family protein N-acetyltransferase
MRTELLGVDAPKWRTYLADTRHDFYHLPEYVALSALHEGGEPAAVHVSRGGAAMLLPFVVRPIPGGGYDATSPYGYPGPLVSGTDDPTFLRDALIAALPSLASEGIVSLFLRLHPLLNATPPEGVGQLVRGGDTISIDLTLSAPELWRQTRANHRLQINRALRAGREPVLDEAWVHFDAFKRLYRTTMTRVAATPYYFFDEAYFDGLRAALGDRLRLWIVEVDGVVATAALFVETCGILQYHLSGSDPAFAREGLMKLIVHFVRSWGKERGDTDLHLGGGVGSAADSLLQFKLGFSPRRHPFDTLRIVVDEGEYARLVRLYERELVQVRRSGTAEPAAPGQNFFPAYRKPSDGDYLPRPPASRVGLRIKGIEPDDAPALATVLIRIDATHFEPHPMTPEHAERIARLKGQDIYLLGFAGDDPVAYGMIRGWDEGYPLASLGIGVVRDRLHQGFGRMMMLALHDAARKHGATSVRLRVHPENLVAQRLYRSLGYRVTGEDRGEILMVVDL